MSNQGNKGGNEFLSDIENDIKNERYQVLWEKYGKLTTIIVGAVLLGVGAYTVLKTRAQKNALIYADQMIEAQHLMAENKIEQALSILKPLSSKSNDTYEGLSQLQLAASYLKKGDTEKAIKLYTTLSHSSIDFFKGLGTLHLCYIKLDGYGGKIEILLEIDRLIAPWAEPKSPIFHLALELQGILALRREDPTTASDIFARLAQDSKTPKDLKTRCDLISQELARLVVMAMKNENNVENKTK